VSQLTARPLLSYFYPDLTGFLQPLAGEFAATRGLLMSLPFVVDYGFDVAMLIDAYRREGLGRLVQVDLEVRQNQHKRLCELVPMADAVLRAVLSRVEREGRLTLDVAPAPVERPPAAALAARP
jgi:glucosyl-3-phosphoglycerate synthase